MTERTQRELALAESDERLRTINDNLPILIAYIDSQEVYRYANATYHQWFGVAPSDMIGLPIRQVLGEAIYAQSKPNLMRNLAGEKTRFTAPHVVDGIAYTAEIVSFPHIKNGVVVGSYAMISDISAFKDHEEKLQELARTDPLTGLPNRRSFEEKLHEAIICSKRTGFAMALMYLDIDHFKQINDTLGHAGGDDVLREFGRRLRASVRGTDTVCRLSGDEFTVIVEGIDASSAAVGVAEKIRAVTNEPIMAAGVSCKITASIGIAYLHKGEHDAGQISKKADDALYEAKRAGRDRYFLAR